MLWSKRFTFVYVKRVLVRIGAEGSEMHRGWWGLSSIVIIKFNESVI